MRPPRRLAVTTRCPLDYAGLATLVGREAAKGPISELEIAAHGSPDPQLDAQLMSFSDRWNGPAARYSRPGAAIIGMRAELVSGQSIETYPSHAAISRRLGQAVMPNGIITWQCCNLGVAEPPYNDFVTAFKRLNPHLSQVTAAVGRTTIGTPGLRGEEVTGYRIARNGQPTTLVQGEYAGQSPDVVRPAARPLDPIVRDLQPRPRR